MVPGIGLPFGPVTGHASDVFAIAVPLKGGATGTSEAIARLSERARPARLEKAARLKVAEDRLASLVAGALADLVAARFVGRDADPFELGAFGKPDFRAGSGLHLSLAHSREVACCAFSRKPVGVDVEGPIAFLEEISPCFTRRELSCLRAAADLDARARVAARLWTRKEALGKYHGCGLCDEVLCADVFDDRAPVVGLPARDFPSILLEPPFFSTVQVDGQALSTCGYGRLHLARFGVGDVISRISAAERPITIGVDAWV